MSSMGKTMSSMSIELTPLLLPWLISYTIAYLAHLPNTRGLRLALLPFGIISATWSITPLISGDRECLFSLSLSRLSHYVVAVVDRDQLHCSKPFKRTYVPPRPYDKANHDQLLIFWVQPSVRFPYSKADSQARASSPPSDGHSPHHHRLTTPSLVPHPIQPSAHQYHTKLSTSS